MLMFLVWSEMTLSMHLFAGWWLLFVKVSQSDYVAEMEFSSTNFDTCWKLFGCFPASWVIYNEDMLLVLCWRVPCCNTLPIVRNLKSL